MTNDSKKKCERYHITDVKIFCKAREMMNTLNKRVKI